PSQPSICAKPSEHGGVSEGLTQMEGICGELPRASVDCARVDGCRGRHPCFLHSCQNRSQCRRRENMASPKGAFAGLTWIASFTERGFGRRRLSRASKPNRGGRFASASSDG